MKWRALLKAAKRWNLHVLIETGTYTGETIAALEHHFEQLYTIELFTPLYEAAVARFESNAKVTVLQGDSAERLGDVLAVLNTPALIWLDAHDSGPGTAAADVDPPAAELDLVFRSSARHVVFIDDACTFTGADGYPTVEGIKTRVAKERPGWTCDVVDDMIQIQPGVQLR